jgi:uncharacterized protein YutE (UPF0331/DUF86 family)
LSPGQLDKAVVRRHLTALDGALRHLRRHAGKSLAALSSEPDALWAVERGLQLCAQNSLDVATHLAASGGRDVADYAAAIDALAALGVLTTDFVARFRAVAGFRNVLVHAYLEVDPARVHAVLNERLDDFEEFARSVQAYVNRQP